MILLNVKDKATSDEANGLQAADNTALLKSISKLRCSQKEEVKCSSDLKDCNRLQRSSANR